MQVILFILASDILVYYIILELVVLGQIWRYQTKQGSLKMRVKFQKAKFYPRFASQIRKLHLRYARECRIDRAELASKRGFLGLNLSPRSWFLARLARSFFLSKA